MIAVTFNGDEERVKSNQHVYQWDTGQKVMVSGLGNSAINKVHFSFKGLITAYVVDTTNTSGTITVDVPDIVLRYGKDIYMYLCIENTTGILTIKTVIIPVVKRNMPENYIFNDEETVETTFDRLQDHETRIESLEDARTNINGSTFETLKGRIDYEVTALNNRITNLNVSDLNEEFKTLQKEVTEARKSNNPTKTYPSLSSRLNVLESKLCGSYGTTDISAGELGTFSTEFTASKSLKFRRYYNFVRVWGFFNFSNFTNQEETMLDIFTFQDSNDMSDHKYWVAGEFFAPVLVTDSSYSQTYITAGLMLLYLNNEYVLRLVLPEGYTLSYLVGKTIQFSELYVAKKIY